MKGFSWQRLFTCAGAALLLTGVLRAQTVHFQPPGGTGVNATLLVVVSVNPAIGGVPLALGDEIGVFTPAGVLGGAGVWTGTDNLAITLWGDDALTTGTVEGFIAGDSLEFTLWDASMGLEHGATPTWSDDPPVWSPDALIVTLTGLTAAATDSGGHFTAPVSGASNASLLVDTSAVITIAGAPIETGDEIGVYTPGGLLAGAGVWAGQSLAVTLWGDDALTAETIEGFQSGEALVFRLWDADAMTEYTATAGWSGGAPAWQPNALLVTLTSLTSEAAVLLQPPSAFSALDLPGDTGGFIQLKFVASPNHPGAAGDLDATDPISAFVVYAGVTRDSADAVPVDTLQVTDLTLGAGDTVSTVLPVATSAMQRYWIAAMAGARQSGRAGRRLGD